MRLRANLGRSLGSNKKSPGCRPSMFFFSSNILGISHVYIMYIYIYTSTFQGVQKKTLRDG